MALGLLLVLAVSAAAWEAAPARMSTRWAAEVTAEAPLAEYPRPTMRRGEWRSLNGLWDYAVTPLGAGRPGAWQGEILVPFSIEAPLSGVGRALQPDETLWYRRTVEIPAGWAGQRLRLHFAAVDWAARVWADGVLVASHRGGYDGFSAELTGIAQAGGSVELVVAVDDPTQAGPQPHGKQTLTPENVFYTATSGIWQTVWLEPVPTEAIDALHLTPDAAARSVTVRAAGELEEIVATAYDDQARAVGEVRGRVGDDLVLEVADGRLWSPDDPYLYRLIVRGLRGGREQDRVESYFGLRSVSLAPDADGVPRPLLNGEFVFQVGLLDQGYWPDGGYTAPTDEALRYDLEVTRELGFNLIRKHVKVEPERWYYWADKLGLLVWQDMPLTFKREGETPAVFAQELAAMVSGRHNHPSIISWVIFNESTGQHETPAYVSLVRGLDPSRLINSASGGTDVGAGDLVDIHLYPGPLAPPPDPTRGLVLGEFGGLALAVPDHLWSAAGWGYRTVPSGERLTESYVDLLRRCWELRDEAGLSAVVYTQTTDVEDEINGLLTYDRAVIKVDPAAVAAANRGQAPPAPQRVPLSPTSQAAGQAWRYTLTAPAGDWTAADYDDGGWATGAGGFGTPGTFGAVVGTVWDTPEIWLRRDFDLAALPAADARLALVWHHDEDVEVWLNGMRLAGAPGFITDYEVEPLDTATVRAALRVGRNVLAVHCRQVDGGQFVDVGVVELRER